MINIDVVVITYNQATYVEQALEGISKQLLNNEMKMRVLIADDCSYDGTLQVIRDYERHHNLSYVYLSSNKRLGMVGNYKRVISALQGDYCCLLEGDDYWVDANKIQKQVNYMITHPQCGLCYTDCDIITDENNSYYVHALFETTGRLLDPINPMKENRYQANVTWMMRKDLFDYVSIPENSTDIPLIFMYEACLHYQLGFVKGVTGVYRLRNGSVSDCKSVGCVDFSGRGYNYKRNVFLQCVYYATQFPSAKENMLTIYSNALFSIYPYACYSNDIEIKSNLESFFEGKLNLQVIDDFVSECKMWKTNYDNIKLSKAYRLGKALLKPFKWLKR